MAQITTGMNLGTVRVDGFFGVMGTVPTANGLPLRVLEFTYEKTQYSLTSSGLRAGDLLHVATSIPLQSGGGGFYPFSPAPILWGMIALDLALTAVGWSPRRRAWLVATLPLSAYLAIAGMFSIGPLLLVLGLVQFGRILHVRRSRA